MTGDVMSRWRRSLAGVTGAILAVSLANATPTAASAATGSPTKAKLAPPSSYVVDLVATAAFGVDMNDAGDVVGTSYPDPGCGSSCLPPLQTVVWKGGVRIVLQNPTPSLDGISLSAINNQGWVTGFVGFPGTTTHAVVWKPVG